METSIAGMGKDNKENSHAPKGIKVLHPSVM
jgi:hypothetical protein